MLIFLGASACTAPKFYIFTEANFYHTGAFQTIHPHKYKLCIIHHRWPLISCCKVWTTGTQLFEPFSTSLWRKVLLLYGGMTLKETMQTIFCELKSSFCIGLNVRQSSPVLWIEVQLWYCNAAVPACAVQLKQTKPNIMEPTKHNKMNVGIYLLDWNFQCIFDCLTSSSWGNDFWQKWSGHLTECKGGGPDSAALNEVPAMVSNG